MKTAQEIYDFILSQVELDKETEGVHTIEFSEMFDNGFACLDLEYTVRHTLHEGDYYTPDYTDVKTQITECNVYFINETGEVIPLDAEKFKNQLI